MSEVILSVSNVGKSYKTYRSNLHRFLTWFGIKFDPISEFWAVKDISLTVQKGEAVAIVGPNGAGKSTLLKVITGTVRPNKGKVIATGRISAILELGIGFNPEFTGRENVRQSGGMIGFSPKEIDALMPEIESFAEINEFFDKPLRVYSSGMQARLAFALATAMRPDILIVDEVLSVGDAYFQHKSFDRIREFREQGTSLLMVSHDRGSIQALCDRAILLEKGAVLREGSPEEVFDFYNAIIAEKENSQVEVKQLGENKVQTISGSGEARVEEIGLYDQSGELVEYIGVGDPIELKIRVKVYKPVTSLVLGYGIRDRLGQVMYGTNTWHTKQIIDNAVAGEIIDYSIEFPANFGIGSYSVQTALVDQDTHLTANYEWRDRALMFNVVNNNRTIFEGCSWNEPNISIGRVEP